MINKDLKKSILEMVKIDQKMRKSAQWNPDIDKENTQRVKSIIKKYGWPGKSLIGEKGSDGIWLLVQHADHDLRFQKKCLRLVQDAVEKGEAKKEHVAYLTDRIMVRESKNQLYGTQFKLDKKNNSLSVHKIKDPKNLSKRRKEMELMPFPKYKKMVFASFKQRRKNNSYLFD